MKKAYSTCVGLLAVLGFLVVVAAIVFPLFAERHDYSPEINCASNEKQLGLAILEYVQDNDNTLPNIADANDPKITWRNAIYPYTETTLYYQCPSRDDKLNGPDGFPRSYTANYIGNYSGSKNDRGDGAFAGAGSKPISLNDFRSPASLIMLCETWHSSRPDFNIDNLGRFNPGSDMLWAGHTDGGNYLFADGHVKWLKPLDTKTMWHRDASVPLSAGAVKVLQNAHLGEGK